MAKKAEISKVEAFRKHVELLKKYKGYTQETMAKAAGIGSSYFSRVCKGPKNPGEELLKKFYSVYGEEIKGLDIPLDAEEPPIEYKLSDYRDDHITTLKDNNKDLRNWVERLITNNEELVDNNKEMVAIQKTLIHRLGNVDGNEESV